MKKVLLVLLVAIMIMGGVFGQGTKEDKTITVWVDHTFNVPSAQEVLKELVIQPAIEKGYTVDYVQESVEIMRPRTQAAIAADSLPDLLFCSVDTMASIYRAKQALDVTDVVAEVNQEMGGISGGLLAAVSDGSKQFAIPVLASSEMTYIRTDVLEEHGLEVPKNLDELWETAAIINDAPRMWALGLGIGTNCFDGERDLMSKLWSYGASVFGADGKTITLDSPNTRKVLEIYKNAWDNNLIPKDVTTWDDSANNMAYQNGTVAHIINTGSVASWLLENNPEIYDNTYLTVTLPGPAGTFAYGDLFGYVIGHNTKNADIVKEMVQNVMKPENYYVLMEEMKGMRIPIFPSLAKDQMWQEKAYKPLADSIEYLTLAGYPGPVTDTALEVYRQLLISQMFQRVLVDDWAAGDAIAETVGKIEQIQTSFN